MGALVPDGSIGPETGAELASLLARLYPICRSITGDGVRETLRILQETIPLEVHEVPSGTPILDWIVPKEWNVRDAYVKNSRGERVIDFRRSNLHVVGYSVPVSCRLSLAELRKRVHSLPDKPDWVPFRSSFYREDWGFCLAHRELEALPEDDYEVCIDSTLTDGSLTYGELFIPGTGNDEILLSAHICHPSLANDNLSGVAVATLLARSVLARAQAGVRGPYGYRFVFAPVTIGAICWLARNASNVGRIKHGLILTLLGDAGKLTYKRSRQGHAVIDRAVEHVLAHSGAPHEIRDFLPYGYDERQYCSPGFDLPVGCLMRTAFGEFPEYLTSAGNLSFVKIESLLDSFIQVSKTLELVEGEGTYLNLSPKAEPQLGRRGIYRALSDRSSGPSAELAMLWVLNQSDGAHSLLDIAERSRLPFESIRAAAAVLTEHQLLRLLEPIPPSKRTRQKFFRSSRLSKRGR